jgi:hypothetical protein
VFSKAVFQNHLKEPDCSLNLRDKQDSANEDVTRIEYIRYSSKAQLG